MAGIKPTNAQLAERIEATIELLAKGLEILNPSKVPVFEIEDNVEVNEEAITLSRNYLKEGNFTNRMLTDTLHIATASVHKVDIVTSWNFRDIVNLNKIIIYNSVNLKMGYPQIEIRNPTELLHE